MKLFSLLLCLASLLPATQTQQTQSLPFATQDGDYPGHAFPCNGSTDPGLEEVARRKLVLLNCPAFAQFQCMDKYPLWYKLVVLAWSIAMQEVGCAFQASFTMGNSKPGFSAEIGLFRLNWGMITQNCDGYTTGQTADSWQTNATSLHNDVCASAACLVQAYTKLQDDQFFAQHRGGVSNVGNSDNGYYKNVIWQYFAPWTGQLISGATVSGYGVAPQPYADNGRGGCTAGPSVTTNTELGSAAQNTTANPNAAGSSNSAGSQQNGGQDLSGTTQYDANGNAILNPGQGTEGELTRRRRKRQQGNSQETTGQQPNGQQASGQEAVDIPANNPPGMPPNVVNGWANFYVMHGQ